MSALGVVEVIGANTSFMSEGASPSVPGMGRGRVGSLPGSGPRRVTTESISELVDANIAFTLHKARVQAEAFASTTTRAALAQALEIAGERNEALEVALSVLAESVVPMQKLTDPAATRIAMQILCRAGETSDIVRLADSLPLDARLGLEVGAALGSLGNIPDAWRFVKRGEGSPGFDAIAGYLYALAGDYGRATPRLRAALRAVPDDADTALNLSISLWNLGATRKAVTAAAQARAAAPAREDIGLHLFELLLHTGGADQVDREVRSLIAEGVVPSARLLVLQARAKLQLKEFDPAIRLLERASVLADDAHESEVFAEVQSNLIRIKALRGKLTRAAALTQLLKLHSERPEQAVIVVNLAQVMSTRTHAVALREAVETVRSNAADSQVAFLEYQVATLEGDNPGAAQFASRWLELEPNNPRAQAATMVALGIGEERWHDAAELARAVRPAPNLDRDVLNNAAYVLAMAGKAADAIALLEPVASESFVLRATLGLAYLAAGDIDTGMKHYRRAADEAENQKDDSRSLMTAYQALVVRQLGLLNSTDPLRITSISLPPYPLPEDWQDRPEFLRLLTVAKRHNYVWPLEL